MTSITHVSLPI